MAKRLSKPAKAEAAEFSRQVRLHFGLGIRAAIRNGRKPWDKENRVLDDKAEAARLSNTLRYIHCLVLSQTTLNEDAQSLLEAITQGTDHPIWVHLAGMKYSQRGTRKPSVPTMLKRAIVFAYTRVLLENGSLDVFGEAVANLKAKGLSGISASAIKGWWNNGDKTFREMVNCCTEIIERRAQEVDLAPSLVAENWCVKQWTGLDP